MKYVLKGTNDYIVDPLKCILNNRGITDIRSFLNIDESCVHDYKLLKNIEEAVQCLCKHVNSQSKILVVVDSDMDGVSSSALLINYFKKLQINNVEFIMHEGKQHGLEDVMDKIGDDITLVICPDAASSDYNEHRLLKSKGKDIIVLDHHLTERYSDDAIVVNNQLDDYPNKWLSGVGITYKFCKALDDYLNVNYVDDFLDLVALGLLGDLMNTSSLETRYYIQTGLKNIKNEFIKQLIIKQAFSMKNSVNMTSVSFYIIPLINACIRVGTMEEKINMFHAFINSDMYFEYQPRAKKGEEKPKPIMQHITETMARECGNIKSRQNNAKEKGVDLIENRINEKNLNDNKILIVDATTLLDKNLTGLVATGISNKYQKPVLLLRKHAKKENTYGGSARAYSKHTVKNLLSFLTDLNLFEHVSGHEGAMGFEITRDNLILANDKINELLKDVKNECVYEVDFIIPVKNLRKTLIKDINALSHIWGFGVEESKIAVENIIVKKDDVKLMGAKQNTLKITFKGIDFMKFNSSEQEYLDITNKGEELIFTVIGKCAESEFNSTTTQQIIIEDYTVVENKEAPQFDFDF